MSEMKRCKQCGLLKDVEEFRQYTYSKQNGTTGRYRICKSCENINTKYKRAVELLKQKPTCSTLSKDYPAWERALEFKYRAEELYKCLDARGLNVSTMVANTEKDNDLNEIDKLMAFYEQPSIAEPVICTNNTGTPKDLQQWLDADPQVWVDADLSPEYLQETIYESLKAKYRPQVGYDAAKCLPIFDDTYKNVLNQILRKFDDYEEAYENASDICEEADNE